MKRFVLLLLLGLPLFSCRTAPAGDPTEEYRLALAAEVGTLSLAELSRPEAAAPRTPGPREERYLKAFGGPEPAAEARRALGLVGKEGERIGVQYFVPRGAVRGTVFLFPGYLDHSGPFVPFAGELAKAGFSVVAADLPRATGFSEGGRGEIGSFDEYGERLETVIEAFRPREVKAGKPFPFPKPWIAVGHSTGASAVFILLERRTLAASASPFETGSLHRASRALGPLDPYPGRAFLRSQGRPVFRAAERAGTAPREPVLSPFPGPSGSGTGNREVGDYRPIRQEGLLIQGKEDDVVDFSHNVPFLLEKIPDLRVVYVDGAGHVPYAKKPENRKMLDLVLAYLGEACDSSDKPR